MPLHRPLAIFFGWTPAKKVIHPSPSNSLRSSDPPFFRPVFGRSKMWWSDASLDGGLCPQNETRSLGFTCHRWGVSFRFGSPCFSLSSLDAHQDKNKKPTALVLLGWSNRFLPQNKFVTFSDFASFYLSVCMMLKTHSEARKTVLNFQRRFGCFIG
ncbi:hypothetical protein OLZ49_019685 [Providencia rettgeri]|nr:hypothetical protein [Providencia rettgeri]